jgi:steroid 5-alpha reductase family enzyme
MHAYLLGGLALAGLALLLWLLSLAKHDVSIVDGFWSLMFLMVTAVYLVNAAQSGPRGLLLLVLVALWAIRLSTHIFWRNWGEGEDRRYRSIRKNNQPHFALKSLYLIFGFQALLAWVISLPLHAGLSGASPVGLLDYIGISLWIVGFMFETVADYQLARFKANPVNQGKVMHHGLWRYTRHPNYFGEFCIWWGYYAIALSAGGWWSIVSPLLMSFLLLRFSGVALLEKDIGERRPAYRDYIRSTNAFFPGPRRRRASV